MNRIAAVTLLATLGACGGQRVLLPPRIDLAPRVPIGLVEFTIDDAQGSLHELATQRFAEYVQDGQPGTEILELGFQPGTVGAAEARALGQEHGLRSVFVGHIVVSDVRPRISITRGLQASAEATVEMRVRLLSTETGGTIWTQSASLRETIAALGVRDGRIVFLADDPNAAYGELVNRLVYRLTEDFRPVWARR